MSKKTTEDVVETVDTSIETSKPIVDTINPVSWVIKQEDGYHVKNSDGSIGEVCKIDKNNAICLTKNDANRTWVMVKVVEAYLAEHGADSEFPMVYKPTRVLGANGGVSRSNKLPYEKLIAYLPEDLQEEFKSILAAAIKARDAEREANKKKPMTEAEKTLAKVNKIIAQLKDMGVPQEQIDAIIENAKSKVENAENTEVENND